MAKYPNGVRKKFRTANRPEKDAAIFELLRAMRGHKAADICRNSFLSPTTISKFRNAITRYPQHLTMVEIAKQIGKSYALIDGEKESERVLTSRERREMREERQAVRH